MFTEPRLPLQKHPRTRHNGGMILSLRGIFLRALAVAALCLLTVALGMPVSYATSPTASGEPIFEYANGNTRLMLTLPTPPRYRVEQQPDGTTVTIDFRDGLNDPGVTGGEGYGVITGYNWQQLDGNIWRLSLTSADPSRVATVYSEPMADEHGYRFILDIEGMGRPVPQVSPGTGAVAALALPPIPQVKPTDIPQENRIVPYLPVIVIDAGHGGNDPGARSANGMLEKNVVLDIAKMLAAKIEGSGRYRARLTREDDSYIHLRDRVTTARGFGADFFMSLHADANPEPSVRGASVYTLSERASDREAARLAARENRTDAIAGVDLGVQSDDVASILIDLAMRETVNDSRGVANVLVDEIRKQGIKVLKRTHRFAGFAVLKSADVPSVLVELGYLSNANDAKLLASRDYRDRITDALLSGIDQYFAGRGQVAAGE